MKIKNSNNIIGFTYFGQTVLVPKDWWLAVDKNDQVYAHFTKPTWDSEFGSWDGNSETVQDFQLFICQVEDLPVFHKDSLVQAEVKGSDIILNHYTDYQKFKIIQAAVGRPDTNQYLTDAQYNQALEDRGNMPNQFFKEILPTLVASGLNEWSWLWNPANVKHAHLHMDLRTCATNLMYHPDGSEEAVRVLPCLLEHQTTDPYFMGYTIKCHLRNNGVHAFVIIQHGLHKEKAKHTERGNVEFMFKHFEDIKPVDIKLVYDLSSINKRDGKNIMKSITEFFTSKKFNIREKKSI